MTSALEQTTPDAESSPPLARRVAVLALLVIFAANLFNYMDRMLVSAMERQLRDAFQLTPTEFGYLWSLFTVGYLVCATPIGYLADRFNRCWLFAICIVIWSAATLGTGLATSKWVLYVSRLFIGVGEAGCLIIGPALLSDYFARRRRGTALSIFYLGQPLGGTAGFILPPLIVTVLALDWPVTFFVAGVPGFALAVLILLFPDPPRGGDEPIGHGHGHATASFADYVQLLKNRSLALIILAQTFSVIILVPLLHYGKEFLLARHGLDEAHATKIIGAIMVMGALGSVVSGFVGDRLARRFKGAYALLAGCGYLAGWACFFLAFRTVDTTILAVALAAGGFCLFLCMPAVNTQIANVVHPLQRAAAWALAVFVLHLLGDTIFPPIFGHVSTALAAKHTLAAEVVDEVDRDQDGKISREEFTRFAEAHAQGRPNAAERAERAFTALDRNKDGFISKERWKKWADKRVEALGRQESFEYFSFALAFASLCCFVAAGTAQADIERFVEQK
jgi:MFS family permease